MISVSAKYRPTPKGSAMGTWKSRIFSKRNKGKSEPGKGKGIHPSPLQRYMCRRNRSWKHPEYHTVMFVKVDNNGYFIRKNKK